eukprot:scaffold113338_cov43-Prasinocladus_malaysianus.AAC.2
MPNTIHHCGILIIASTTVLIKKRSSGLPSDFQAHCLDMSAQAVGINFPAVKKAEPYMCVCGGEREIRSTIEVSTWQCSVSLSFSWMICPAKC